MSIFQLKQSNEVLILDFVGANVAKKLHAGHMRNLNIGESLRRILKLKYPQLLSDNHWGDWGVNMGILIWGWKMEANLENYKKSPIDELTRIYVWANSQKENVEKWQNWDKLVRDEFVKLEQKDAENYTLWQDFVGQTKGNLEKDLKLMNVPTLDLDQGESFYEREVLNLWSFLEKNNIWQSDGKARFFDFEEICKKLPESSENLQLQKTFASFGRCYLVSSSGYTSYAFRDIAARIQWIRDLNATKMITITGNEQIHHFHQVFGICHYLASLNEFQAEFGQKVSDKLIWQNLVHISYGFLTLQTGKMSSRKGNVLTISDLFLEVQTEARQILSQKSQITEQIELETKSAKITLAALKWYDLNRGSEENLVLNIAEILNFVGNTGVYQLYTLARLKSILKKNASNSQNNQNSQDLEKTETSQTQILQNLAKSKENLESQTLENNSEKLAKLENSLENLLENFEQNVEKTSKNIIESVDFTLLNSEEKNILKKLYLTDLVLDKICTSFKPHLLCNHLFELCTLVNSWYSKYSVSGETDNLRKQTLLKLVSKIVLYLQNSLELLAIESVEEL